MDQQTTKRFTHTRKSRVARCCNDRHGALVHFIASEFRRPGHGSGPQGQEGSENYLAGRAGSASTQAEQRLAVAGLWRLPSQRPQKQLPRAVNRVRCFLDANMGTATVKTTLSKSNYSTLCCQSRAIKSPTVVTMAARAAMADPFNVDNVIENPSVVISRELAKGDAIDATIDAHQVRGKWVGIWGGPGA